MFFCRSTIEIDGFSMVFSKSDAMVSDGFDLEKDLKMRMSVTDLILQELCVLFRIHMGPKGSKTSTKKSKQTALGDLSGLFCYF